MPGRKKPPKGRGTRGKPFAKGPDPRKAIDSMWKPGQSGNPPGSSRLVRGRALLKEIALETVSGQDGIRYKRLMRTLFEMGEKKNLAAIKEILDRLEGKSPQPITGEDLGPIKTEHKLDFSKLDKREVGDLVETLRKLVPA